ncbi:MULTISPECIES: DUF2247 family protein [unclassified Actinopolyspora]|uniref:DUF2247 family protein n=1 Tax=unclassified Actinopolyspora TaxID=2639451 RepID=UPI0013F64264|nr:DUF2247 family protein [Actinopolyspora sp. BKK2]NHE77570.1 DUF2247 family protein [Actinopolyspora sp. BKK1]
MSWLDLVDSTEGVRAIYGYHAPRLGGARVDETYLKNGRNSVDLRFDMPDLPTTMPKKWAQRGADTLHLHITFSDVESLVIRGQSSRKIVDLDIDPLEGNILVTARSDHFELDMRAERALLQQITDHRGGPIQSLKTVGEQMKEFRVLRSLGLASWAVLRYGIEHDWIGVDAVADYAADVLAEERDAADDRAVRLAVYDFEGKEGMLDLCSQLEKLDSEKSDPEKILKAWILAHLIDIDEKIDSDEKQDEINDIYGTLGSPRERFFCGSHYLYVINHYTGEMVSIRKTHPSWEFRKLINDLSEELSEGYALN